MSTVLTVARGDWDPDVVVGYPPTRRIAVPGLHLGPGSRLRSGTVIYLGSRIGARLDTGHHVVIREETVMGDDCSIWSNSVVSYGCHIGSRVRIHANAFVCEYAVIEDGVFIGPGVVLTNDVHPGCTFARECMKGPVIRSGAQIGAHVTILPRVEIGAQAVIGAGSVVTRPVPPRMVVAGVPARVICPIHDLKCTTGLTDVPYPVKGG